MAHVEKLSRGFKPGQRRKPEAWEYLLFVPSGSARAREINKDTERNEPPPNKSKMRTLFRRK